MKTNFLSLKNIFLVKHWWLVLLTLNFNIFSQTSPPESISYQGVARDASGNILSNQPIGIQFLIHQGSPSGTVVFSETHSTSTNAVGIFTLAIGSVNTSTFKSIPWNNGPYFLEVLMDPTGGSSYTSIGTQQLLSVPYALYAKSSYTAAGSFSSAISYSTNNAPPISINSNTSASSTTLTFSQGSNSSSVAINFPPPPPANITMSSSGIVSVSPTSGNAFTLDVPPPTLNVTSGTSDATISITQGSITTTQTLSFPPTSINGIGTGIASTTISGNSFTVDVPSPSLSVASGASDATITITQGTATTTQTLSFPPAPVPNVSINATGIVTVSPNSGTAFTIGAPTPTLVPGNNISITGTYPNFNISSTPTLSIAGNNLSISGGNTVTLPASNVTLNTTGIVTVSPLSGNNFNVNVPAPTLNVINGTTQSTISIAQGTATSTKTITFPASNVTLTPAGVAAITPTTGNNFTVTVPPASLTANTNTTTGVTTFSLTHGLLTTTASVSAAGLKAWSLSGNTVTASDYLGTNNAADLIFKTSGIERMRITPTGSVGIGTNAPMSKLHVDAGSATKNALQLDNGHIKTTTTSAPTTTNLACAPFPNGWLTCGPGTMTSNSTDVSGAVYWTSTGGGTTLTTGDYYVGRITFSKPYSIPPNVVLTLQVVASSFSGVLTVNLRNVTTNWFDFFIYTNSTISGVTKVILYYMVIE